jgi:hypothetical protein
MTGHAWGLRAAVILSIGICVSPAAAVNPSLSGSLTVPFIFVPDDPEQPGNQSFWYWSESISGGISLSVPSVLEITTSVLGSGLDWTDNSNWNTFPLDTGGLSITASGSGTYNYSVNGGSAFLNVLGLGGGPTEGTVQTRVDFTNIDGAGGGNDFGSATVVSNVVATKYNVTLPTGAHMNDNASPTLQNLTVNSGASINNGGFTRTIRQNLTNHGSGEFNDDVGGNFINDALSGSGNVANARFLVIHGQLQNTGELHIPGLLKTNSATGNSGTIKLNGGHFNPQAAFANNGTFLFSSGALNGPGVVTNNGTFDWSGDGYITGSVVNATSSFTLSGTTTRRLGGTLTNQGTITQSGGHILAFDGTGILDNQTGALYDILDDSTLYEGSGGVGTINNSGTFRKSGGSGVTTASAAFNNTGSIVVTSGTLRLFGGGMLGGTTSLSNGATLKLGHGNFDIQGIVSASGNGTLEITDDGNTNVIVANGNSASFANFTGGADLLLTGGHLRADEGATLTLNLTGTSSFEMTGSSGSGGGQIGGQGSTTNLGNFAWTQGSVVGNFRNESNAFTISGLDSHYITGGQLTNAGTITHSDSELNINLSGAVVNESGALYDITGDGDILAGAVTDTVTNAGTFRKSGGSGLSIVNAPFTNTGTLAVDSGKLLFAGNDVLTLDESGTLAFKLSGSSEATDYGTLELTNNLVADGSLEVTLESGYVPSWSDSFNLLDWFTISGTFDDLELPELDAPLEWDTSQLYVTGVLAVIVPGDFNFDSIVDAADYVVWRKGLGTIYTPGDFDVWRAHFGLAANLGAGSSNASPAVPEPSAIFLAIFGLLAALRQRVRRSIS